MTDRITHERARETDPRVERLIKFVLSCGGECSVVLAEAALESLATRPSPEPSSKPGELARDAPESVWLVQVGHALLNYVARTEEEANAHIGPDVAQGFKAVEYVPREPAQAVDADEIQFLRGLVERMGSTKRHDTPPAESEVGALHVVHENSSGYLEYTSRRTARYAGGGRWDVGGGAYTLWHQDGGSVYYWSDVPESLRDRALVAIAALRSRPAVVDAEVVELAEELDAAFGVGDNGKTFDEAMHEYWPTLSSALRLLVKRP